MFNFLHQDLFLFSSSHLYITLRKNRKIKEKPQLDFRAKTNRDTKMPSTTSFTPEEVANECSSWLEREPWINQNRRMRLTFLSFVSNAYAEIHLTDPGPPLFIHIVNFDAYGNQLPIRRIDYIHALATWTMGVTRTRGNHTQYFYSILKGTLLHEEAMSEPARDARPVDCLLLQGKEYTNGHM